MCEGKSWKKVKKYGKKSPKILYGWAFFVYNVFVCFIQTGRTYVVSLFLVCGVTAYAAKQRVRGRDPAPTAAAKLPEAAAYREAGDCMRNPVEKEFRRKTQNG